MFLCYAPTSFLSFEIEPADSYTQRNLILLAKVLQNLANEAQFGGKEDYMSRLNDFIVENQQNLRNYFDRMASQPEFTLNESPFQDIPEDIKQTSLFYLYCYIYYNREKITDTLAQSGLDSQVKVLI